jgi:hypothetical protein
LPCLALPCLGLLVIIQAGAPKAPDPPGV